MKHLNYKIKTTLYIFIFLSITAFPQEKSISITIDDVPNTTQYQKDNFEPVLLNVLDSLAIPFTIFINEDKILKTGFHNKNKALLAKWIENDRALIGNHTYSHSRYSEVGIDSFAGDIEKGEVLTKHYATKNDKKVPYFRFPFNDMGKDSIQHIRIKNHLKSKGYRIAPFTVESSDWMFDYVYRHYLEHGEVEKAKTIGKQYVEKTMELVMFYETLAHDIYNRPVKHIYLCHDNAINADYLAEIISRLKQEDYKIVSFEEALADPVYEQNDAYYKKWGISWLYRWMDTQQERIKRMKQEPDLSGIEKLYEDTKKE